MLQTRDRLAEQVEERRSEVRTDDYSMSIGEIISIYGDGELDLHPEFQRFFRWTDEQKTKLIESVLLGIPIPPIYVATRPDGVWDVIDGLQRLSTIMEFVGILRDDREGVKPGLKLLGTEYLPGLLDCVWDGDVDDPTTMPPDLQRQFKRAKLHVVIIDRESALDAKYELFQRLNTGGTALTDQEVRNCILVMLNADLYEELTGLAESERFVSCVPLSTRQVDERYDLELVTRFLAFCHASHEELERMGDVGSFLTRATRTMAHLDTDTMGHLYSAFEATFDLLSALMGEDAFRKYVRSDKRHKGAVSVAIFEAVAVGIGRNCRDGKYAGGLSTDEIKKRIKGLSESQSFMANSGSGIRGTTRVPIIVKLGEELFRDACAD